MDHRWRTNHDATPNGSYAQTQVGPPYAAHSLAPAIDVRPFHVEIARLRQLLAAAHAQQSQQAESIRRTVGQTFSQKSSELLALVQSLKQQLATLEHESSEAKETHELELSRLKSESDDARKTLCSTRGQIDVLKRELENVANAAATEQQELSERHESYARRNDIFAAEKIDVIASLESQIIDQDESLATWQVAHDEAIELCEWHDRQHRLDRTNAAELSAEYDQFRFRTSEGFANCESQIETLEATVGILRTDHETVELINSDLDHRNDELQSFLEQLQTDLESVIATSQQDRQESLHAIETLHDRIHTTRTRLMTMSEEKQSLIESVAKLKAESLEFDASMFAKDQEIQATNRVAVETQSQLEQFRREHTVVAGQNDKLRNQIREMTDSLSRLDSEFADATDRISNAEMTVSQRDRQLREFQSAARAADATALLRANEAEQQYAVKLQRLEDELERQIDVKNRDTQAGSNYQNRIAELESELADSRRSAKASSVENDRLQQAVDQQTERVNRSQQDIDAKDDRIALLDATILDLHSQASCREEESAQMKNELGERRAQLAEYADRIATQQNAIARRERELVEMKKKFEQADQANTSESQDEWKATLEQELSAQWLNRVNELEQSQLTLRERHHQTQLDQQRIIESLQQTTQEMVSERELLGSELTESASKISELETQLDAWSAYENPLNEVKRLSNELARRIADHARERETLYLRIEQLQSSGDISRAA